MSFSIKYNLFEIYFKLPFSGGPMKIKSPLLWTMNIILLGSLGLPNNLLGDNNRLTRWALNNIITSTNPIFAPIKKIYSSIGKSFCRIWEKWTGKPWNNNGTVEDELGADMQQHAAGSPLTDTEDEPSIQQDLTEIEYNFEQLYRATELAKQEAWGAMSAIEQQTIDITNQLAKKASYAAAAAGGGGTAILYWIHSLDPVATVRKARFTGLEGPAILAGAHGIFAVIQPFLMPIGALILGGIVWHKFKQSIIAPYKLKHEQEYNKIKRRLNEYNQTTQQTIKGIKEETKQQIQEIHKTAIEAKKEVGTFIKNTDKGLKQKLQELNQSNERIIQQYGQENEELKKALQEENQKLVNQFTAWQNNMTEYIAMFSDEVKDLGENQQELKQTVNTALPKLDQAIKVLENLDKKTTKELEFMQQHAQSSALTTARPTSSTQEGGKKKKKHGLSLLG